MGKWLLLYQNPETAKGGNAGRLDNVLKVRESPQRAQLFAKLRREIKDERVVSAMERLPREHFMPLGVRHMAYLDQALPIASGQTISQPTIVAMMTSALQLKGHERVLEVGTGSGYQAAVLALLAREVVTVERHPGFMESAKKAIESLGIANVRFHLAAQGLGLPDQAPFDAIIVTAAAPRVPASLIAQLAVGGRLVIPVGPRHGQDLLVVTKTPDGTVTENLGPCGFVPLIDPEAWPEDS
jgi:protein-L-isoaspartate(D-aspartate) O-methyltransferase